MNRVVKETRLASGKSLQLVQGDLTAEATDAIVNAANRYLRHGGGVAAAIVRRGGPSIQNESNAWVQAHGPVMHSNPAWTGGGKLAACYVIHAVGPQWGEGQEAQKLHAALTGALTVANELKVKSMALPAISTGIFGFPLTEAAKIILGAIREYFSTHPSGIELVRLVLYDDSTLHVFEEIWDDHIGA